MTDLTRSAPLASFRCWLASCSQSLLVTGPAFCGKTHFLRQVRTNRNQICIGLILDRMCRWRMIECCVGRNCRMRHLIAREAALMKWVIFCWHGFDITTEFCNRGYAQICKKKQIWNGLKLNFISFHFCMRKTRVKAIIGASFTWRYNVHKYAEFERKTCVCRFSWMKCLLRIFGYSMSTGALSDYKKEMDFLFPPLFHSKRWMHNVRMVKWCVALVIWDGAHRDWSESERWETENGPGEGKWMKGRPNDGWMMPLLVQRQNSRMTPKLWPPAKKTTIILLLWRREQ